MVYYLYEIPVKIPTVHPLSVMSVIAPISASSILSVHPSDDEHQEIPEEFPVTPTPIKYGENFLAKYPDDVTLTLCNVKFLEKVPGNSNRVTSW